MRVLIGIGLLLLATLAQAHKASDSYLQLSLHEDGRAGWRWDLALRDVDVVTGLDANQDRRLTWGEVMAQEDSLRQQATRWMQLQRGEQACQPVGSAVPLMIDSHTDGNYLVLQGSVRCASSGPWSLDYHFLQDVDASHRLIAQVQPDRGPVQTLLFSPSPRPQSLEFPLATAATGFGHFWREGVHHIWSGYDHLMFLLSLLLPVVLVWRGRRWQPGQRWQPAVWEAASVVTAFTLAHSITLGLAAMNVVHLPSRLVESLIAASVVLAALHNLWPILQRGRWIAAFGFGLIHGFGFASALADLTAGASSKLWALAGFNLGVETGQLAVVAVFLPLAWRGRRSQAYPRWVLAGGSWMIASIALVWLCQRVFNLVLIPG